jgi:hypothetical protein
LCGDVKAVVEKWVICGVLLKPVCRGEMLELRRSALGSEWIPSLEKQRKQIYAL